MKQVRKRIFEIIERAKPGDMLSLLFDYLVISLIFINIVSVIFSSFDNLNRKFNILFQVIEISSVAIFSVEYILRLITADLLYKDSKRPYLRFIFSFMALVDLMAILPFYLPLLSIDLRSLRALRLFRLLRILKINRYNNSLDLIGNVFKKEKETLFTTLFVTSILLLIASTLMYYVENEAQPDKFPNILASLWWAVATMTTVGYGDVYPVTAVGKILSGIIAVLGIGLVALPTAIISSGFISEVSKKNKSKICPHCGQKIDE